MTVRRWATRPRAFVRRLVRRGVSTVRVVCAKAGGEAIVVPWSTSISRAVVMRATDGGRICLGEGVVIGAGVQIVAKEGVVLIGDHTEIGAGSVIVARRSISIGQDALIAEYVTIRDQDHVYGDASTVIGRSGFVSDAILIGDGAWIGAKATVLRGCSIGRGAVVGAHALVRSDVPDGMLAVGVPARVLPARVPTEPAGTGEA